jgi:PIN domain nuclease of toxin-antitoxin system
MDAPLLLDTCAAIWFAEDHQMSALACEALDHSFEEGISVFVSPITAWEIGLLVARGRLGFTVSPQLWFRRLMSVPGLQLAEMAPDLLIASSLLPGTPPRDPADRILASTARECGYRLVTRDRPLLRYAEDGHVQAVVC